MVFVAVNGDRTNDGPENGQEFPFIFATSFADGGGVRIDGNLIVTVGDLIQPHDDSSPHDGAPFMLQGSPFVYAYGRPVCFLGALANCGHVVTITQNDFVSLF